MSIRMTNSMLGVGALLKRKNADGTLCGPEVFIPLNNIASIEFEEETE